MPIKSIPGFTQDLGAPDEAVWGIFGTEGSGKTYLCATAGEWSASRGEIPGWIVCDRKTRKTVRDTCDMLKIPRPFINEKDFVTQAEALTLAANDDVAACQKIYTIAQRKLIEATIKLGETRDINPIVIDSGTQLWDWIAYAHFGKKQEVGRSRVWGPPKQDWTDLVNALSHKTLLITLRAKDEYKNDAKTGRYTWDGPVHLGYNSTSVLRMRQTTDDDGVKSFALDVVESQDNKALEGQDGLLTGDDINFTTIYEMLRG